MRSAGAALGARPAPPLVGRDAEHAIHEQARVVLIVALEGRRGRAGKHPGIVLPFEKAGWHGGAWTNRLRIEDPLRHPVGLKAATSLEEIRGGGDAVVRGIAGG